jgi:hypothetical protein
LYHIFVSVDLIESCKVGNIFFQIFDDQPLDIIIPKSLSLSSSIIFSAIFFQIHFIHSIVLLSSILTAFINLSIQRERICIATFQPIQEIFINSLKTFFSPESIKPNKLSLFSVI